jgi:hypothetical protein
MTNGIGPVSNGQSRAINKGRLLAQRQAEVTALINGKGGTRTLAATADGNAITLKAAAA